VDLKVLLKLLDGICFNERFKKNKSCQNKKTLINVKNGFNIYVSNTNRARQSGTHYRLSFVICLSVLVFLGAFDTIRASSALQNRDVRTILCYIYFRFLSI